jgi:hypothetical protein
MPEEGWEALSAMSAVLATGRAHMEGEGHLGGERPTANRDVQATLDMARHLGSSLAPDGNGSLAWVGATRNAWAHLNDTAKQMARELILPALARADSHAQITSRHTRAALNVLVTLGVRRLARCLSAHMAGVVHDARLGLAIQAGSPDDGWGEATPEATWPGGLTLRFLASQAELSAEAAAMDHCVSSYGQACANHSCAILSLGRWGGKERKKRTWVPSSTAEVRVDAGGLPFLQQHYGYGNQRPVSEDREAASWWLTQVRDGQIVIAPGAIRYMPKGTPSAEDLPWLLGAAWRTPEAHGHRWDRWRRLLGARPAQFGDWLLSLPPVFFESHPFNSEICAIAVDMDDEMAIAREIAASEASESVEAAGRHATAAFAL